MRKNSVKNPRYPHQITITRVTDKVSDSNNPFTRAESDTVRTIVYDGKGRSFTDTTTDGDGKVDTNKRNVSIPVRFDEWPESTIINNQYVGKYPKDGDEIEVVMGNVTERGRVKDFEPDNDRSIIYWEYNRNTV